MIINENGRERLATFEEELNYIQQCQSAAKEYWQNTPYKEAVNNEIRKRYTVADELAIQRQRDEKPEEYLAYYTYCEQCKTYVKEQIIIHQ